VAAREREPWVAPEGDGGAIAPRTAAKGNDFTGPGGYDHNPPTNGAASARGGEMAQTVTRQDLETKVGQQLGVSDWFADVTLDHQFVHVDLEKAKKTPFGGTIAHGFLTLSLLVHLCLPFIPNFANRKLLVNYGFDKVRFSAPVKVGKRIRAVGTLGDVSERKPGNVIVRVDVSVEIEGEDKPALVAEWLSLHVVG
jgi:acyl dehydratase